MALIGDTETIMTSVLPFVAGCWKCINLHFGPNEWSLKLLTLGMNFSPEDAKWNFKTN